MPELLFALDAAHDLESCASADSVLVHTESKCAPPPSSSAGDALKPPLLWTCTPSSRRSCVKKKKKKGIDAGSAAVAVDSVGVYRKRKKKKTRQTVSDDTRPSAGGPCALTGAPAVPSRAGPRGIASRGQAPRGGGGAPRLDAAGRVQPRVAARQPRGSPRVRAGRRARAGVAVRVDDAAMREETA